MARITAGVGSSHVPLLGVAHDQQKDRDAKCGNVAAADAGRDTRHYCFSVSPFAALALIDRTPSGERPPAIIIA